MLNIDINADHNLVTLRPTGALSETDFARLTEQVDGYIDKHDQAPNIMIVAKSFPYWDSFKAMGAHVKFVRDHHRLVKKIAIVGDSLVLSVMPSIGDLFVAATVKHFSSEHLDEARRWATTDDQ
jgi:SpoIIAA-like